MLRRRALPFVDFPLPPGGLSDAASQERLDGYARADALLSMAEMIDPTTLTNGPAHMVMTFARNHTEHATAATPCLDQWAAKRGYKVAGLTSALSPVQRQAVDGLHALGYQVRSARAPKTLGQFSHHRAAADYLAATIPLQPRLPQPEPRMDRPCEIAQGSGFPPPAGDLIWATTPTVYPPSDPRHRPLRPLPPQVTARIREGLRRFEAALRTDSEITPNTGEWLGEQLLTALKTNNQREED